ncbi:MAG: protein translocase subunit SecD [Phototrophicales bacterium]|nr:MAG: protein translocase subunit SecD [Phototrophicales bacterium]
MENYRFWLAIVLIIAIFTGWINIPDNPGFHEFGINFEPKVVQGLDLQGGSRVLLEAAIDNVSSDDMEVARGIIERRVNGLGLTEAVVQLQGGNRIIVELPGVSDRELALETIQATALLEFVDYSTASYRPSEGACLRTTAQVELEQQRAGSGEIEESPVPTIRPTFTPPPTQTPAPNIFGKAIPPTTTIVGQTGDDEINAKCSNGFFAGQDGTETGQPYRTIMTGEGLDDAIAVIDPNSNQWQIAFTLTDEGSQTFFDHTSTHIGQQMAIVLDGVVLSAPTIQAAISRQGTITGSFTAEEARSLANQLRYGALPVPLEVSAYDQIGPTLGAISIQRSVRAGVIGVLVVLAFMIIYYRVPGVAAALALLLFASINFALYKTIPVTLTLSAITGFLISIGTAVDGNILIFERMKEELRDGKRLERAVELGFERAWTSIRDSNISTILICIILFVFGRTFGASAVQGFAITLGLGLVVNLFTAVIVTRTFLALFLDLFGKVLDKSKALMGA